MKKYIFCSLVMLITCVTNVFSDGENVLRVQSLIESGLFKNKMEISSLAPNLTAEEKSRLIEDNRLNSVFPMYMNGAIGFGIGSFLAKDYIAGSIHCAIDVACDVVTIAMFAIYAKSMFGSFSNGNGLDTVLRSAKIYLYTGIASALVLLVNRIAQVVSVTAHVNKYNATLVKVLAGDSSGNNKVAFSIFPVVEPKQFGIGFNIALPKKVS